MSCECGVRLIDSLTSTEVCRMCGRETYVLQSCNFTNCGFQTSHSPFLSGYSRTKRFKQMSEMLLFPTPSNPDTPALKLLTEHKDQIKCLKNIICLISESDLKDKRFCSLHLFSRIFNPLYKLPVKYNDLFFMLERMTSKFQMIELRYKQLATDKPFINYTYLLRNILDGLGYLDYLKYVKILKCNKRKERYRMLLESFSLT